MYNIFKDMKDKIKNFEKDLETTKKNARNSRTEKCHKRSCQLI